MFNRPARALPHRPVNQNVVLGWVMIIALLVAFVRTPRFRLMSTRYFTAHGIWRSAVQENRDPMTLANVTLLVTMALLAGTVIQLALRLVQDHPAFEALWTWSSPATRALLDDLLNAPAILTLVIAGAALLLAVIWMVAWYGAVGRRYRARFSQVLMLSVWPRWPILLTLPPMM